MLQDMRGLFFIVQGQYKPKKEPVFYNPASESNQWCGGFDPEDPSTAKWYALFDWPTLTCHRASSDLDFVAQGVVDTIVKYKTRENFVTTLKGLTFGVSSRSSKALDEHLGHLYGEHFAALVKEMEDEAYTVLKDKDPVQRARRLVKRRVDTPIEYKEQRVSNTGVVECNTSSGTSNRGRRLVPKKRNITITE